MIIRRTMKSLILNFVHFYLIIRCHRCPEDHILNYAATIYQLIFQIDCNYTLANILSHNSRYTRLPLNRNLVYNTFFKGHNIFQTPSTRKQKVKEKRFMQSDVMCVLKNKDVMLGNYSRKEFENTRMKKNRSGLSV